MSELIEIARAARDAASLFRKDDELDDALEEIRASAAALKRLWNTRRRSIEAAKEDASPDDKDLVNELAETYGVMGGIHRSRGEFREAIKAYDEGMRFEQHPARKFDNSYNLVQRLLNRVLLEPTGADGANWTVMGVHMGEALEQAGAIVARQRLGPRRQDPWIIADDALIQALSAPFDLDAARHRKAIAADCDELEKRSALVVFSPTLNALRDARHKLMDVPDGHPGVALIVEMLDMYIDRLSEGFARVRQRESEA